MVGEKDGISINLVPVSSFPHVVDLLYIRTKYVWQADFNIKFTTFLHLIITELVYLPDISKPLMKKNGTMLRFGFPGPPNIGGMSCQMAIRTNFCQKKCLCQILSGQNLRRPNFWSERKFPVTARPDGYPNYFCHLY